MQLNENLFPELIRKTSTAIGEKTHQMPHPLSHSRVEEGNFLEDHVPLFVFHGLKISSGRGIDVIDLKRVIDTRFKSFYYFGDRGREIERQMDRKTESLHYCCHLLSKRNIPTFHSLRDLDSRQIASIYGMHQSQGNLVTGIGQSSGDSRVEDYLKPFILPYFLLFHLTRRYGWSNYDHLVGCTAGQKR